jgi:hypothetical protein
METLTDTVLVENVTVTEGAGQTLDIEFDFLCPARRIPRKSLHKPVFITLLCHFILHTTASATK